MTKTRHLCFARTLCVCFFLFFFGNPSLAIEKTPNELQFKLPDVLWENTILDFDFFNTKVRTALCHKSEAIFLSCIASVRAVLQHDGHSLELLRLSWWEAIKNFWNIEKSFGSVYIVQQQPGNEADLSHTLKQIRTNRSRILAWRDIYRSGPEEKIDFDRIRDWIFSSVVDRTKSASYAAAAVNGYLSAQDPHAQIIPARVLLEQTKQGQNRYFGIGVSLHKAGNLIVIGRVVKGGPAFNAGLRSADEIYSVDGETVDDKRLEDVVATLRGPKRSGVVVKVKREGRTHRFQIIREEIEIKNVSHAVLLDRAQRWGYIKIETFAAKNTCRQVREALSKLKSSDVTGLILDLRDNMGGLVAQSTCVADLFLEPNLVVLETRGVNGDAHNNVIRTRTPSFSDSFMVTLVNATSGSASEILAGALQDHRRSFIIGERTFGKGSIQVSRPWHYSGSIIQMYTAARYFLPSGRTIQFVGITPDSEVFRSPTARAQDILALREVDLFPTALPAIDDEWKQPRTAQVEVLKNCIKRLGLADRRMHKNTHSSGNPDYQLYYAQDVLACMHIDQIT